MHLSVNLNPCAWQHDSQPDSPQTLPAPRPEGWGGDSFYGLTEGEPS
jgi:hypothetical protein